MGVRVHGIKPISGGGVLVRMPSLVERNKIVSNAKFVEIRLNVSVVNELGLRVLVQSVHQKLG